MNKTTIISLVVIVVLGVGIWYASTQGLMSGGGEGAVATVNGAEITRAEYDTLRDQVAQQQGVDVSTLDAATQAQFQTQLVDTLVSQKLLRQEVEKAGITVTGAQVDEQVETIKGQFEDEAAFLAALETEGLTEAGLREQIQGELELQAYFEQKLNFSTITATDAEVDEAYEQIASSQEEVPPLEEVRDQVKNLVIQQKQQEVLNAHIQELRAAAEVEVLI